VIGTDATEGFVEVVPTESFERQGRAVGTDGGLREARLLNWYYASVGTDGGLREARPKN
jgi:hypothetical protein